MRVSLKQINFDETSPFSRKIKPFCKDQLVYDSKTLKQVQKTEASEIVKHSKIKKIDSWEPQWAQISSSNHQFFTKNATFVCPACLCQMNFLSRPTVFYCLDQKKRIHFAHYSCVISNSLQLLHSSRVICFSSMKNIAFPTQKESFNGLDYLVTIDVQNYASLRPYYSSSFVLKENSQSSISKNFQSTHDENFPLKDHHILIPEPIFVISLDVDTLNISWGDQNFKSHKILVECRMNETIEGSQVFQIWHDNVLVQIQTEMMQKQQIKERLGGNMSKKLQMMLDRKIDLKLVYLTGLKITFIPNPATEEDQNRQEKAIISNQQEIFESLITLQGSKQFQRKLYKISAIEMEALKQCVSKYVVQLSMDEYGNYFLYKLIKLMDQQEIIYLYSILKEHMINVIKNQHGTFFFQKFIQQCDCYEIYQEIYSILMHSNHFLNLCLHQYSTHAIKQLMKRLPDSLLIPAMLSIQNNFIQLSQDKRGVCILKIFIQKLGYATENSQEIIEAKVQMIGKIGDNLDQMIECEYGNYVIQEVIKKFQERYFTQISQKIFKNILTYSKGKYSSIVVAKTITFYRQKLFKFQQNYQHAKYFDLINQNTIVNLKRISIKVKESRKVLEQLNKVPFFTKIIQNQKKTIENEKIKNWKGKKYQNTKKL